MQYGGKSPFSLIKVHILGDTCQCNLPMNFPINIELLGPECPIEQFSEVQRVFYLISQMNLISYHVASMFGSLYFSFQCHTFLPQNRTITHSRCTYHACCLSPLPSSIEEVVWAERAVLTASEGWSSSYSSFIVVYWEPKLLKLHSCLLGTQRVSGHLCYYNHYSHMSQITDMCTPDYRLK